MDDERQTAIDAQLRRRADRSSAYQREWKARDPEGYKAYYKKYMAEYFQRRKAAGSAYVMRRARTKDEARAVVINRRFKKYGITKDDYDSMIAVVPGCAICGFEPQKEYGLKIDHDHVTGRVRGLLCDRCNHGLGHFKDTKKNMAAAIEYLGG